MAEEELVDFGFSAVTADEYEETILMEKTQGVEVLLVQKH